MTDQPIILTPWRWPHFTADELRCKCGCGRVDVMPAFMDRLERLREAFGAAMTITSGFRCPSHNAKESATGTTGPHTTGRAVDIAIRGQPCIRLMVLALKEGFTGIGLNQKGPKRFLHIDDLPDAPGQPRPTCWSY